MGGSAESDVARSGRLPPEASQLRISDFGQRTLLAHQGIGERRLLEGRWQLLQDVRGNGILAPTPPAGPGPSRSPMWVAPILELKVVQQLRGDGQGLALTKKGDFLGWVDDLQRSCRQALVFEGGRHMTDRMFIFGCVHLRYPPKSCSAVVWWDPSYALKELLGLPKYDS